jgi:hypothetical protein
MADLDLEDAPAMPVPAPAPGPATTPTPTPNPDAQTTVNDFLDYTEFYPSDLVRSLTLIGDLDSTYAEAVQQVHELTSLYCKLPQLPDRERPDPAVLRKQIAQQLQTAINQREYAYTEAARLYEVTVRHCQRSSIIKRKLQAQPEPPSRDPTPPPVSPSALKRSYDRPRLHLTFDGARKHLTPNRGRQRAYSVTSSDESDGPRRGQQTDRPRKAQTYKDRPHKQRSRPPGVAGTNVHSSIAGISTSNALAKLTPPPADARPGSKWAPWLKLTEYEMAVLRKQMKKNAVWTPSMTMVNRELERKHRTRADYEQEMARCEAAGEQMLDEEPETLLQIATAQGIDDPALSATANAADGLTAPGEPAPAREREREDTAESPGGQTQLDTRRKKARGGLRALEDATKTIQNAADGLKELTFVSHTTSTPPTSARKRSATRPATNKRKRDTTPPVSVESPAGGEAEAEATTEKDTNTTSQPEPKRPRLQLIAPAPPPGRSPSSPAPASDEATAPEEPTPEEQPEPVESPPAESPAKSSPAKSSPAKSSPAKSSPAKSSAKPSPAKPSPAAQTPVPEEISHTVQVPLAPAGPGTPEVNVPKVDVPEVDDLPEPKEAREQATPVQPSPSPPPSALKAKKSSPVADVPAPALASAPAPAPAQPAFTAPSTRSQRKSITPKHSSPPPVEPSKPRSTRTSVTERAASTEPTIALRPRSSRSHVPTPKAQSEEPKPNEGRPVRDTRRHSIFSQSALTAPAPTRASARRKPPPKGEVTSAENGQKTVTRVKRSQGSKINRKKKPDGQPSEVEENDSDDERYCICNDIAYGDMISCDNNVSSLLGLAIHLLTTRSAIRNGSTSNASA